MVLVDFLVFSLCSSRVRETCDLIWLRERFAESLNAGLLAQERDREKDCCAVRVFSQSQIVHSFLDRLEEQVECEFSLFDRCCARPSSVHGAFCFHLGYRALELTALTHA